MTPPMSHVVSNTSTLTNLAVIGRLELVREQLCNVVVPESVWREMLALPHPNGRSALLSAETEGWLHVATLINLSMSANLRLAGLDQGESEAISLAVETSASRVNSRNR